MGGEDVQGLGVGWWSGSLWDSFQWMVGMEMQPGGLSPACRLVWTAAESAVCISYLKISDESSLKKLVHNLRVHYGGNFREAEA